MGLVEFYQPVDGQHDAAVDERGRPRPGWDGVLVRLDQTGSAELERRQRAADRLAVAEGAGYLLHDGQSVTPPWQVGVVPFVLAAPAWKELSLGLAERAEVLRAVLRDLAGPRELLRAGVIPLEAVATHPGFTTIATAASGEEAAPELTVAGSDVVLDAEGRFQVTRDLTDVASGVGLALLARSIAGRVTPGAPDPHDLFGHNDYLRALRSRLAALAPTDRSSPRCVLLTGPPDQPGYVENAYLAARLGYSLTEPADLVVQGGRVWLRSLDGPEPIDVLLRSVPALTLDPVEDHRVNEGLAGVVQATRAHAVAVANTSGSGVVESLGLLPFLDAAARHLHGRGLRLASVPTLWCGDPDHRAELLAAPERFVLYDTDPYDPAPPSAGAELDEAGLAGWRERVEARPERYVAQRTMPLATTPYLRGSRLQPAVVSLRTQVLLGHGDDRSMVFPGAHARLWPAHRPPRTSSDPPTGTADVWVLHGPDHERVHVPVPALGQVDLRRSLPTRTAEAMYWTGRAAERAEMAARTALACLTLPPSSEPQPQDFTVLIHGLRAVSGGISGRSVQPSWRGLDAEVRAAVAGRPGSVVGSLRAMVMSARGARPMLSARTWRLLAMLDDEATALEKLTSHELSPFDATDVLDQVLVPLAALAGLTDESVTRGPGWRFLDIGRRLERALLVLGLAEALLDPAEPLPPDAPDRAIDSNNLRLDTALAACESLVAYRRSFRSDVTLPAVGDLLLGDPDNPRSVRFQLDQLAIDLHHLPDRPVRRTQLAALRAARRALDEHLPLVVPTDGHGERGPTGRLVLAVRGALLDIGQQVITGWFSAPPRRV